MILKWHKSGTKENGRLKLLSQKEKKRAEGKKTKNQTAT